jgi:hypothetical protein
MITISVPEIGRCRSPTVYLKDPDACNAIHVGKGKHAETRNSYCIRVQQLGVYLFL